MTRRILPLLLGAIALGAVACGTGSAEVSERSIDVLTPPTSTTAPASTTTTVDDDCHPLSSYPRLSPLPTAEEAAAADTFMRDLLETGKLVVAVDENTQGLASRDPETGDLSGTEIQLAEHLAQRLFGGPLGDHVQFKTVTTKEKVEFPNDDRADLAISAISMNCERWEKVAFSTEYLTAVHAYLVRSDSPIKTDQDIAGRRVCVTKGSTSIGILEAKNAVLRKAGQRVARPVPVDARTDCLLALQEGDVDAYLGHDTFLTGMQQQDPGLGIVPEGREQHYGIAIGKEHTYFVQYVNGALAEMRANGELQDLLPPGKSVPPVDESRPRP